MTDIDPKDIQAKIAHLKGQIQRHKDGAVGREASKQKHPSSVNQQPLQGYTNRHRPYHTSNDVRLNRDLSTTPLEFDAEETGSLSKSDWITTASRNAQIINATAYNPTAARDRILDPSAKIRKQTQMIRQKLNSSNLHDRQLTVDGIRYNVQASGGKLVRVKGFADDQPTPKQVMVSGIPFQRSKNGNLYRSSMIRRNWYDRGLNCTMYLKRYRNSVSTQKKAELCKRFSNTGSCSLGPKCPYLHDTSKTAICREFLRSGSCPQGQHCDLSHDLAYERVPACVHFVRGGCTKEKCQYPHVRVNPAAPVCRLFTTFGYCSKGVECKDKHVFECPDYAQGKCMNLKCRLPHVDRAGQLRQRTPQPMESTGPIKSEEETPIHSGSDIDSEDEVMMDIDDNGFSQEQDFMKF